MDNLMENVSLNWSLRAVVCSAIVTAREPAPNYSACQSESIYGKEVSMNSRGRQVCNVSVLEG